MPTTIFPTGLTGPFTPLATTPDAGRAEGAPDLLFASVLTAAQSKQPAPALAQPKSGAPRPEEDESLLATVAATAAPTPLEPAPAAPAAMIEPQPPTPAAGPTAAVVAGDPEVGVEAPAEVLPLAVRPQDPTPSPAATDESEAAPPPGSAPGRGRSAAPSPRTFFWPGSGRRPDFFPSRTGPQAPAAFATPQVSARPPVSEPPASVGPPPVAETAAKVAADPLAAAPREAATAAVAQESHRVDATRSGEGPAPAPLDRGGIAGAAQVLAPPAATAGDGRSFAETGRDPSAAAAGLRQQPARQADPRPATDGAQATNAGEAAAEATADPPSAAGDFDLEDRPSVLESGAGRAATASPAASSARPESGAIPLEAPAASPESAPARDALPPQGAAPTGPRLEQLVEQLRLQLRPGTSRISFIVDPPELGRVTVQLSLRRGRLVGELSAEDGEVVRTLQGGLDLLRSSLKESGLAIESLRVQQETQQDAAGAGNGFADRRGLGHDEGRERSEGRTDRHQDRDESARSKRIDLDAAREGGVNLMA